MPVSTKIAKLKQQLVQEGMSEGMFQGATNPGRAIGMLYEAHTHTNQISDVVFERFYDCEALLMPLCKVSSCKDPDDTQEGSPPW